MKRVLLGVAIAAAAIAPAVAQGTAELQDKVFKMVDKCQIDMLKDQQLPITPPSVLNAKNAEGVPFIVRAAETACNEGVEQMILVGADVNAADNNGRTVLHAAAEKSTDKMVKMLIERGAKVDAVTKSGETVLQIAAKNNYKGKTDTRDKIIKILKDKGAK
jgi:ankyrin repeat protein